MIAVAAAMATAAISFAASGEAAPGDARAQLDCASGTYVTTSLVHDGVTAEKRTPAEQAASWASAPQNASLRLRAGDRVAYASAERTDLAFDDTAGRTSAILSYERHDGLGWLLESIVECAQGGKHVS